MGKGFDASTGTGIGITPEQGELAAAVRGWAARAVPPEEVRKLLDAGPGRRGRPAYWDGLAAMGLLGLHLPEEYGGGGGELLDLAVALEETGRAALPGPYLPSVLASELLRRGGARTWRAPWPPATASAPSPSVRAPSARPPRPTATYWTARRRPSSPVATPI